MNDREVQRGQSIPSLVAFAVRKGVGLDELFRAAGLDVATLGESHLDVPNEVKRRLWDEAARLSGDPSFGLHMGEWIMQCPEEHFDVLVYAIRSCATLGDHYRRMGRYVRLLHPGASMSLVIEGNGVRLIHDMRGDIASRHPTECMLAMAVLHARRLVGDDFAPRQVHFTHSAPERTIEQERVFRAPVHYACTHNELLLDRADLDRPQHHAEPRLQAVLERQLEELLARLPQDRSVVSLVRRHLADLLLDGEGSVRAVATKVHMSPRTLQRRLHDEGTTFAEVLSALRRELALQYLQDEHRTINEVTFLLGFAEVSAFHHAFKRWTGKTPAEYQRTARATMS